MDFAYNEKLAENDKSVKSFLVRQDLFERTADAKGLKTKDSKETIRAFWRWLQKRIEPRTFGSRGESNLLESLKSWGNTNLLYNDWDQGCICWTYTAIPEKYTLPLRGRLWMQIQSQIDSIPYKNEFWKKLFDRIGIKECKELRHFIDFVQQTTTRI